MWSQRLGITAGRTGRSQTGGVDLASVSVTEVTPPLICHGDCCHGSRRRIFPDVVGLLFVPEPSGVPEPSVPDSVGLQEPSGCGGVRGVDLCVPAGSWRDGSGAAPICLRQFSA